ncbi:MAG TPA: aminoacyl-tRNA hydrolase [Candidatus Bathyarchaeia archaeon]|nr:aminoacyl-tRNA hydrolase [Candidatus Bathyarchaeia archaeon]
MAQAIIGLGNPGPEYRDTRHNVGARVLDALAKKLRVRFQRSGGHLVAQAKWRGQPLFLIKPQCFMNVMGPPVARATRKLKLLPADIVLIYDDLDLPLGRVRVRLKGSAGGHNGVRSLIASLGTDQLRRVKVGIGRPVSPDDPREGVVDHVLSAFEPEELPAVDKACAEAAALALKQVEARGSTRF